ncbi:hypothetical protein EDB84DRAFT_1528135 [Lactarius hengduanensis]|nr:hypothetical protein EDB84DRAFT_1528135 [Lactarius hengduanensis]
MLTRSSARALLNRMTTNNDKLPGDVLLEIFDAYRQLHEYQPSYETCYEKVWNSRDGWFKLAHVCRNWRHIVFLSPSRLQVHLLFIPHRSPTDPVLRRLPPFPISVDYRTGPWIEKQCLAFAAIKYRSRMRGIVVQNPCFIKFLKALGHPFPKLERLEISLSHRLEPILPTTFLSGSAPSLRRLTLRGVVLECLPPLLSSATGLVELSLTLRIAYGALPEASLIANLQRMSCLRRLELKAISGVAPNSNTVPDPPPPPAFAGALSKLTDLILVGHESYLQVLVRDLAAPSLQHLNVEIKTPPSHISFVPRLCKFIRDAEHQFIEVRLYFSNKTFGFYAETCPKSGPARPFRIVIPQPVSWEEIGIMLSGPLSTVEELVVDWQPSRFPQHIDHVQWRGFFNHIRRVKTVQVSSQVALHVARSFQLGGQDSALDLFPALEQVEVPLNHYLPPTVSEDPIKDSILDAFEPFVAARKQVGRPVRLSLPRGVLPGARSSSLDEWMWYHRDSADMETLEARYEV